jgi:[ribosomal protein S18]-alanine N-acetyltransferase
MPERIVIRKAHKDDLSPMMALENRSFKFDLFDRKQYRYLIAKANSTAFVLMVGKTLAGSAIILWRENSTKAHLYTIAVDPSFQGRGLGRKLLEACLAEARKNGCDRFALEVRADNRPAIALYKNMGYEITARVPKYYEDGCAALQMLKRL